MFCLLSGHKLSAQKLHFEHLTVKDDLPQNTVAAIVKDKFGFMWFGTYNGLCRYDGYQFKTYYTIPGDSSSIANNRIHRIYKDKKGILWITTFNSFICRYNYQTDNFTRFRKVDLPKDLLDSTNRRQNLVNLKNSAALFNQQIGSFKLSQTKEHIVFNSSPNLQGGLSDNNVYTSYLDSSNILWLGTANGGVNKGDLNAKKFNQYFIPLNGKNSNKIPVTAIATDQTSIWIGTPDSGVVHLTHNGKILRRFNDNAAENSVRSIFKDSKGQIWFGYRYGLDKFEPAKNKLTEYFRDQPTIKATSRRFSAISEDPISHLLWFGTTTGMLTYHQETGAFEKQTFKNHFNNSSVVALFFDSGTNLWIGTSYEGIIYVKRDQKTKALSEIKRYSANGPRALLPDNRVYSIVEDEYGNIWAGTTNGLCRISPQSGAVKVYTKSDGLADQYIAKIIADQNGYIWISHKKGLSKLAIRTGIISNYSLTKSILGYEGLDGAGYFDLNTKKIYFGGIDGYVSFLPKEISDNSILPTPTLTALQVLNKPVNVGQKINDKVILLHPLHLTKEIILTNADRSFSIEFSALHYSAPEKNQYTYKLEGFDKDWIHTDATRRIATYANLPAGRYLFKVKATNSDGVWNKNPTTLQIIILPPWWRTWWAYSFYLALSISILYLAYRYIRAQHIYQQRILKEQLKAEKAEELERLKSSFFTHISHEFRTPLTLIIDPLAALISGTLPHNQLSNYYNIMQRNAQRLLRLVNQFLDFRKLESGKLALHVSQQDLVTFVRNTIAAFQLRAKQRNIKFIFKPEFEQLVFNFDADIIDKILFNLISNAFKFTPDEGEITVYLGPSENSKEEILISVRDNGTGIPSHLLAKVFDPFYQVNQNEQLNKGGSGVGLALTKELVALYGGEIKVSSKPNIETCFSFTLQNLNEPTIQNSKNESQIARTIEPAVAELQALNRGQKIDTERALILIVEDNDEVRNYLKLNLGDIYQVQEASNGNDGLTLALIHIPDLIISDVMMPGLNGFELCKKLKTDEKTSHIPVILLTARQADQYQALGYETGADAYIGKPFSSALLLVRIKNLIDSRRKLRELFNKATGFNPRVVSNNAVDQAFMERATKLIEDHMANENFSVEWMASQLFLSRTQLYRKIKALTNQSVHDFVTTIRLNKASDLLLENQLPVSEIAYLVGYADSTSFSRSFQKQFGQTPKKYGQQGHENSEQI